ncbi:MAG: serine hydrolase [Candidatus Staskawiczbacteria bacterium]|jgi:D-alanyl-D-alanine carboxypeptidase
MNLKRIIGGPLLAIIFLGGFVYTINGAQRFFDNSAKLPEEKVFLGSVSSGLESVIDKNSTNELLENPVAPVILKVVPLEQKQEINISAKSVISVESDLNNYSKIIFEKNSDEKLPIASLTKLMTAIIVLDNYNLSDTWVVSKIADSQSSIRQDVKLGQELTIKSFLEIMLVESSNKSAYALSELVGKSNFIDLMNQKAEELELKDTIFVDPTGLSHKNVSTAKDLVKLTEYIIKNYPQIAEISQFKKLYVEGFGDIINTDQLLGEIPEIVCSKTGFTTLAKGCLLLAVKNPQSNNYLINVVLGSDDRFGEMKKLINWSVESCK